MIAILYFLNYSSHQWTGVLREVFFGAGDAGKLISSTRRVSISKIYLRRGMHTNQERAYLFYDVLHNDTMTVSGAKSHMALVP